MTKHFKYQVKIVQEDERQERNNEVECETENSSKIRSARQSRNIKDASEQTFKFKTMKDVCTFLDVSYGSLYNLRKGRLQCKHYNKVHLKNITIEKIDFERVHLKPIKEAMISEKEFHNQLKEKYDGNVSEIVPTNE